MDQMNGDCANYALPMQTDLKAWDKTAVRVQSAQDDKSAATVPLGQRLNLSLHPQNKVVLVRKPDKEYSKGVLNYAGLTALKVESDGVYRVSMGSKIWLDLIESESGESLKPTQFEMQTACPTIFKAVEFKLAAGKKYFLQLTASAQPAADVLVRKP